MLQLDPNLPAEPWAHGSNREDKRADEKQKGMRSVRLLREQELFRKEEEAAAAAEDAGLDQGNESSDFDGPVMLQNEDEADMEISQIIANAPPEEEMTQMPAVWKQGLAELDFLCDAKVRELTGESDAKQVTYFEAVVNTHVVSLGALGQICPRLERLKLNNSNVESIRDLGTSLRHLRVLWLNRSGLVSLDGLGSLSDTLEELYVAFNHINDFSPLADDDFEALRIVDFDSNEVDDIEQVEFLASCKGLQALTLDNNPVAAMPGYAAAVHLALPRLETLDDMPMDTPVHLRPSTALARDVGGEGVDERSIISESIKLSRMGLEDIEYMVGLKETSTVAAATRPGTAMGGDHGDLVRPGTASRPGTAMMAMKRPGTALTGIARPGTPAAAEMALARPSTPGQARPGTSMAARPGTSCGGAEMTSVYSSSDLTFGSNSALCGGISRALRNRTREVAVDDVKSDKSESPRQESPHEGLWGALRDKEREGDEPGRPEIWRRDSVEVASRSRSPKPVAEPDVMVITHDEPEAFAPEMPGMPVAPEMAGGFRDESDVGTGKKSASPQVSPSSQLVDPWRATADQDEAENAPESDGDGYGSWDD